MNSNYKNIIYLIILFMEVYKYIRKSGESRWSEEILKLDDDSF